MLAIVIIYVVGFIIAGAIAAVKTYDDGDDCVSAAFFGFLAGIGWPLLVAALTLLGLGMLFQHLLSNYVR